MIGTLIFIIIALAFLLAYGLCKAAADVPVVREDTGKYDD